MKKEVFIQRKEAHCVQDNKVGLMTDFLLEIMQARRQRSNIFKVLKGKKYCQDRTLFPAKLCYASKEEINIFADTLKQGNCHHQKTYATINVKESHSSRREIIPDRNVNLLKGMKSLVSGTYGGNINNIFSYFYSLFER